MSQDSISYNHFCCFQNTSEWIDLSTSRTGNSSNKASSIADKVGEKLPFKIEQIDGVFILLLFCFLFFAHIYNGGIGFLREKSRLIFSGNIMSKASSHSTLKENVFSYFLLFQALVLISIALYDVLMVVSPLNESMRSPFVTIVLMVGLMALFLCLKIGLYNLIGFVFDAGMEMKLWTRTYLIIFEALGIVLFFPTLLLIYSDSWSTFLVGMIVLLLILAHLVLFYKLIAFFITKKFNFLYLITYLCAIEILPCVFLALGLVYIYRFDVFNLLWLLK